MTIGEQLRQRRDELGITNKALAIDTGIRDTNLCAIFTGKRNITLEVASRIARVLKATVVIGPEGASLVSLDRQAEHVNAMVQYILHFEEDDFRYNCHKPHDGHVYYHAYAYYNGEKAAEEMLKEVIEERES